MNKELGNCGEVLADGNPLSYGKVLRVFSGFLKQDKETEVVRTEHGYVILVWNEKYQNYTDAEAVTSPRELAEYLAGTFTTFLQMQISGEGAWDLTPEEKAPTKKAAQALLDKCFAT